MNVVKFMALAVLVGSGAISLHAQELALDFVGDGTNGFQANLTLGWSFEVQSPVRIQALGFFDHFEADEDGLAFDHQVRIWTDEENPSLLASTLINNSGYSVPSAAANGRWIFNDIVEVILLPGHYVIGADDPACVGGACDRFRLVTSEFTMPGIVFGEARSASPTGTPQSSQPQLDGGYFGPSMMASTVLVGDVNGDNSVDLLDVAPFVEAIQNGTYIVEADVNFDGAVDLLDVQVFVDILAG